VRGDGGQKPIAGDSGATFGEEGGLEGDNGALLMVLEEQRKDGNKKTRGELLFVESTI
jgi:hypothetical protein